MKEKSSLSTTDQYVTLEIAMQHETTSITFMFVFYVSTYKITFVGNKKANYEYQY